MKHGFKQTHVLCLSAHNLPNLASSLCVTSACLPLQSDTQLSSQKLLQRRVSFHWTIATHTLASSELCTSLTSTCAVWQTVSCFLEWLKDSENFIGTVQRIKKLPGV